ncbi:MAG: S41 family peptidase [Lachnospiraceae bacterium]|nr:S41 family peptidase [Lachnospiraceae bacterium]
MEGKQKKNRKKRGCLKVLLIFVLLFAVAGGSFYAGRHSVISTGFGTGIDNGNVIRKLNILEAYAGNFYLNKIDSEKMEEDIYKGFANGLEDPYAAYYTKEEYKQLLDEDSGSYDGIGVSIVKDTETGYAEIVSVFKGAPAYNAGIKTGDMIIAVNKKNTAGMELQEVVSEIKRKDKKNAILTIYREGKTKDYDVKKSSVKLDTVESEMKENKIGYIMVSQFLDNTDEQFEKAVNELSGQGMKGLIIDLRDNGGGLLDSCINMVSRIIPKGKVIVYTKDKAGKKTEYNSKSDQTLDLPIVILVNENTASASEIMTGCLKDYGKATVVGMKTFGKGIVQNIFPLPDGSAFKFTISKYYTPNGNDIHKKGITPDINVEISEEQWKEAQKKEEKDVQLKKAMELLN